MSKKNKFYYEYEEPCLGETVLLLNSPPAIYVQGNTDYSEPKLKEPTTLYHYCNSNAFQGIISSKTIWLSSLKNTNDYTEIIHLKCKIEEYIKTQKYNYSELIIINTLMRTFLINLRNAYSISLTPLEDKLSQWRGYGEDGKGFTIGFRVKEFGLSRSLPKRSCFGINDVSLLKVSYNEKEQKKQVKKIINEALQNPNKIASYAMYLAKIACICKSQDFHEENEWRILCTPTLLNIPGLNQDENFSKNIGSLKHRNSINQINIPYYTYPLEEKNISSIILGPKNNMSKLEVQNLLKKSFGNSCNIDIKKSKIPYR